jgi:hypothetical protein
MRAGWLEASPDLEPTNGGDAHALTAVFAALKASALSAVKEWASDVDLVFDGAKVQQLIHEALQSAEAEAAPDLPGGWDALDY